MSRQPDVPWKCPKCSYEALVLPSIYIQCHCGELSSSPAKIRRKVRKTKEPPINFTPPDSDIDGYF